MNFRTLINLVTITIFSIITISLAAAVELKSPRHLEPCNEDGFQAALEKAAQDGDVETLDLLSGHQSADNNVQLWREAFEYAYQGGHLGAVQFILSLPGCFQAIKGDLNIYMRDSLHKQNYLMMAELSKAIHSHTIEMRKSN